MSIKDAKEQCTKMSDNYNQVDLRDAQMLALTTKLHHTKATCVHLMNAAVNSSSNSYIKDRGGSGKSRRDGPKD